MSKFKAGDKIQCTGCIDQIDQDGDAYVRFPGGNSKNLTVILAKELERAKLIEPAPENTTEEPDYNYKAILFALCASIGIDDNKRDIFDDVIEALRQAGIPKSELDNVEEFSDIVRVIPKPVKTLYGTVLVGEEDEK